MSKEKWIRCGIFLVSAILYFWGIFFCQSAKEEAKLTYIALAQKIDAAAAEEIFEQEKMLPASVGFCFWGETAVQMASCKETGGITEVTKVLLSGNPGVLGAGILAWQDGCYVDEATAQRLFGTADCGGQTLWLGEIPYRVFGTISTLQPTMLTITAEEDGAILNRCVLSVPPEQSAQTASQFLLRWGLQGEMIDYYPLWAAVHNFLLILPGIVLLASLMHGIRCSRMKNRVKTAISLLSVVGLLVLLCGQIIILPDMIPSRWSDFSFWGNWLESQKENLQMVLLTPMGERHLQMMLDMVKSILSSTAAFLIAAWTLRRQRHADTAD